MESVIMSCESRAFVIMAVGPVQRVPSWRSKMLAVWQVLAGRCWLWLASRVR